MNRLITVYIIALPLSLYVPMAIRAFGHMWTFEKMGETK